MRHGQAIPAVLSVRFDGGCFFGRPGLPAITRGSSEAAIPEQSTLSMGSRSALEARSAPSRNDGPTSDAANPFGLNPGYWGPE